MNLLFLDVLKIFLQKHGRETVRKIFTGYFNRILLRRSTRNEERCSISNAFISETSAPGNQFSSPNSPMKNFEVVKNGAGSLQQFEMEKDYYIQKQKDEIALLRSQVSAI